MLNHKTLPPSGPLSYLHVSELRPGPHTEREGWYGHVERSIGAVKTDFDLYVNGKRRPGRPKMTWKQPTERDRREWKLSGIDPHDRDTLRSGVRSAMRAASQLPGRGPTVVDMAPIPAQKSDDDDEIILYRIKVIELTLFLDGKLQRGIITQKM